MHLSSSLLTERVGASLRGACVLSTFLFRIHFSVPVLDLMIVLTVVRTVDFLESLLLLDKVPTATHKALWQRFLRHSNGHRQ